MNTLTYRLVLLLFISASLNAADGLVQVPPAQGDPVLFSSADRLRIECTAPEQLVRTGQSLQLFAAALYNRRWYAKADDGEWRPWNGDRKDLTPFAPLGGQNAPLLGEHNLEPGEYLIYCAAGPTGEDLQWISSPAPLVVFAPATPRLHAFQHPQTLQAYLRRGGVSADPGFVAAPSAPATPSGADALQFSETNLQESGVDEADTFKTHQNHLYALAECNGSNGADDGDCLRIFTLQDTPPGALQQAELRLGHEWPVSGLYLQIDAQQQANNRLITLASGQSVFYPLGASPSLLPDPGRSTSGATEVIIHGLSDPLAPQSLSRITLDGELVASRRIGNLLYLVTVHGRQPVFFATPTDQGSAAQPANLPRIRVDGNLTGQPEVSDCFLPPASAAQPPDPILTSLTALPLDDPSALRSVCIAGPIEALYVSPRNAYLASTRYNYQILASGRPEYAPEHQTDVHKFALDGVAPAYRGSATLRGHLGWETDKRAFRFGEYNDSLRVATSLGSSWDGSASTRVVLLEEDSASATLRQTGSVEHLGKPGERLYATRFLADKGYLVTFRVTDPLYVLDLKDPQNPRVAGELTLSGYSDYLHPVGANFLLGVGKDALADDASPDRGGRGAWYQGLKLALFDVSDPARPMLASSVSLGKRGTDSELLRDHHALSYLPARPGLPARIALPVDLHERIPTSTAFNAGDPSSFYQWSHSGLYVMDIDTGADPSIRENTRIIAEAYPQQPSYSGRFGERSVLGENAVHYLRAGKVHSAALR